MFATAYNQYLLGVIAGDIVALPTGQAPSAETVAKVLGVSVSDVEDAVEQRRRAGEAPGAGRLFGKAPPSPGNQAYEEGRRAFARALGKTL